MNHGNMDHKNMSHMSHKGHEPMEHDMSTPDLPLYLFLTFLKTE